MRGFMSQTPSTADAARGYAELGLLIGGQWVGAEGRSTRAVVDPATEEVLGLLPLATPADLDAALEAATGAFAEWRAMPAAERAQRLERGIELVRTRTERIARVMTRENGKPLTESRIEIHMACEMMKWNAEEGRRVYGRILQ